MKYLVVLGRLLFASIFIWGGIGNFSAGHIAYGVSGGVPLAHFLVPLSGVFAVVGGLSILLGYRARAGAILIILFLLPVTFMMHAFWKVADPAMHGMQQAAFMKNISMLGAALLICHFGSGPLSLDARCAKCATKAPTEGAV